MLKSLESNLLTQVIESSIKSRVHAKMFQFSYIYNRGKDMFHKSVNLFIKAP